MIDVATFEEDGNQLYQRAFADDELIFHNPLKKHNFMQVVDTLEEGLRKFIAESEGYIEKEPWQEYDEEEFSQKKEVIDVQSMPEPGVYYARSGRAVKPPKKYGIGSALAASITDVYNVNCQNLEKMTQCTNEPKQRIPLKNCYYFAQLLIE